MLRFFVGLVCVGILTGCSSAGGKGSLFSGANARVPAPGTGSYGKPANDYYPKSSSLFSSPGNGVSAASTPTTNFSANNQVVGTGTRNNSELPWQTPNVASAGFSNPQTSSVRQAAAEAPVQVITPNVNLPAPTATRGMSASDATAISEPRPFPTVRDLSELPKVNPAPRVRLPGSVPATSSGENPFRAMQPQPAITPQPNFTPSNIPSSGNITNDGQLRWRSRN